MAGHVPHRREKRLDEIWTMDDRSGGVTVAQLNDGSGAQRHFALCNVLGSVTGLTDETGALVEAWQYDAYGRHTLIADGPDGDSVVSWTADDVRTTEGRSAVGNTALFTGQRWDAETGLHYYKNRYFSSERGKFIASDPYGSWYDEAAFGNRYTYCGSEPVAHLDLFGGRKGSAQPPGNHQTSDPGTRCEISVYWQLVDQIPNRAKKRRKRNEEWVLLEWSLVGIGGPGKGDPFKVGIGAKIPMGKAGMINIACICLWGNSEWEELVRWDIWEKKMDITCFTAGPCGWETFSVSPNHTIVLERNQVPQWRGTNANQRLYNQGSHKKGYKTETTFGIPTGGGEGGSGCACAPPN